MRLIDHTTSPYTARPASGPTASFGRIARQQPLAFTPVRAIPAGAAVPIIPGASVLYADGPGLTRLHAEARRARARAVGELFARVFGVVAAAVRGRVDAWKRGYARNLTVRTLSRLDTRTLRDLGLDRSELLSAAYDLERDDYTTRLSTVRAANALRLF